MKTTNLLSATLLVVAAAGCTKDNSAQVKTAQAQQAQAEQEYRNKKAALESDTIAASGQQPALKTEGNRNDDRAQAARELKEADGRMTQARQDYSARARERLQKIDARANDISVRANNSNAKTRNDVTTDWQAYSRQRDVISQRLNGLYSIPKEQWGNTTQDIDAKLTELDSLVQRMEKRVEE